MRPRVPKSILFGVPLSVGFALFMLATGAELWMAGVGLGIGLLVVLLIAMFTDGSDPVAVTTVHWRGGDRRAIVVRYSRWKFGCGSFVVIASVAGFGFVVVMASRDIGVAALAAAIGLTVSVPLIALVVGPNEVVLLRDGLLIRRGLLRDYVPWASIADIGVVRTYGEYATEFLRVTPRTPDAIESNRPGQLWRRVLRRRDIPLSLSFLRAPAEDLVHTVMRVWRDPRSIELSDPSVAPQRRSSPSAVAPRRRQRRRRADLRPWLRNAALLFQALTIGPFREYVAAARGAQPGVELLGPAIGASVAGAAVAWVVALTATSEVPQWALLTAGGWFLGLTIAPGSTVLWWAMNRRDAKAIARRVGVAFGMAAVWLCCAGWPIVAAYFPTGAALVLGVWAVGWVGFFVWLGAKILGSRAAGRATGEAHAAAELAPSLAATAPSDVRAGIEQVVNGSATFAIFHTDYARNRYVQIVGGDDGGLIAEAVSNAYLPPGEDLGDAAIESLRRLGWEGPDAESGNYRIRLVAASADEIGSVAGFLLRTLREVYGLGPDDLPRVELG